jgi:hypothetical protein
MDERKQGDSAWEHDDPFTGFMHAKLVQLVLNRKFGEEYMKQQWTASDATGNFFADPPDERVKGLEHRLNKTKTLEEFIQIAESEQVPITEDDIRESKSITLTDE